MNFEGTYQRILMSFSASITLPPSCSSDGFETVVTRKKHNWSDSESKPRKGRPYPTTNRCSNAHPASSSSSSRKNSSASFGRASWAKPTPEASVSVSNETLERSNMGVVEPLTVPGRDRCDDDHEMKDYNETRGVIETQTLTDPGEGDFRTTSASQPLSALLPEYGEQDLEWQKVVVPQCHTSLDAEAKLHSDPSRPNDSRLGLRGKAPIHIEFVSFGYLHGAPVELRNGWSHAQPLAPWDTRESVATRVPQYLAWQDGLSGAVKRAFLAASGAQLRELAEDIAEQVAAAMVEAMDCGGRGYALPLHAKLYVASELGRHRSVVLTELAATSLRRILRANVNNRFACPCSVETTHRDIERKQSHGKTSKSKQKELEDD